MSTHESNTAAEPDCGLLMVGHGSREQAGINEFLATARLVAQIARELAVESCFLEFARPTIAEGFRALAERGVRRIVAVPVMLFAAGHAKRDIPAALAAVASEHPDIAVERSEPLGCDRTLLAISKLRFDEALRPLPHFEAEKTGLVMVGRGSRDPLATTEMLRFVQLRRELTPLGHAWACFISMAEPKFESTLGTAAACGAERIVVQPHLLFAGVLLDRVNEVVDRYARRDSQIEWLVTAHLGVSAPLAEAIFERASLALATH